MTRTKNLAILFLWGAGGGLTASAVAQDPTSPKRGWGHSPDVPATDPAVKSDGSLHYEVIAVKGKVRMGPSDLDPKFPDGWSFVKVGDTLRVKLLKIDNMGRIRLSRKAMLDKDGKETE